MNKSDSEKYVDGMARLAKVMPRKMLKKHLIKWINKGLTVSEKLFETQLLLIVWSKDER